MCKQLINVSRDCGYSLSGVNRLWVSKYNKDLEYGVTEDQLIIYGSIDFTELELDKLTGNLVIETSLTANGHITKTTVTANFNKADNNKLKGLTRALLSDKIYVLVLDNNGYYWFIGIDNGAKMLNLNTSIGTSGQYNGHSITITSTSANPYNASQIQISGEFNDDFNNDFNN